MSIKKPGILNKLIKHIWSDLKRYTCSCYSGSNKRKQPHMFMASFEHVDFDWYTLSGNGLQV